MAEVRSFPTIASALAAIEALDHTWRATGRWTLAQILEHAAQSVEYSMSGFPRSKPALFQATAGRIAFSIFDGRGHMKHGLAAAIPGAPVVPADAPLGTAMLRAVAALQTFEAHEGPLAPHFAYGPLDKSQFTRAHLMHLADHWTEVTRT
jgi:hypothetical protein